MFFPMAKIRSLRFRVLFASIVVMVFYLISLLVFLTIKESKHFWESSHASANGTIFRKINFKYVAVHLDLKGAPPNLIFLTSLLHMIKQRGANAILMEYEDMFPYDHELVHLSAPYCYNRNELKKFLITADLLEIEVIPLIQTFGHLEHVLKLPEYYNLREVPEYPDTICPTKNATLQLIRNMLKQVIHFHNEVAPLEHIHIGCDEVYSLNQCSDCRSRGLGPTTIMVEHIRRVTGIVKELSNKTNVLVWDDMLRKIKPMVWQKLVEVSKRRFDIIEPVYWDYAPEVSVSHVKLRQYHMSFDNVWVASAFKGADGPVSTMPNIGNRISNHYQWMKLLENYKFGGEKEVYNFKGIILTGWSRYDHFMPLCDLLPVSIPSLFTNLLIVNKFSIGFWDYQDLEDNWKKMFFRNFYLDIKEDLGCTFNVDELDFSNCRFDTVQFYRAVRKFNSFNRQIFDELLFEEESALPLWKYYLMRNFASKHRLQEDLQRCMVMNEKLTRHIDEMSYYLTSFYDRAIVNEYIGSKSFEAKERLAELIKSMKRVVGDRELNFSHNAYDATPKNSPLKRKLGFKSLSMQLLGRT